MTLIKFFQIFIVVAGISGGQILFKLSARDWAGEPGLLKALLNPWLLSALAVYGACTLLWVYVLRDIELARAYPVISLSFLIVPLLSWAFLGEKFTLYSLAGALMILGGIYLISFQD